MKLSKLIYAAGTMGLLLAAFSCSDNWLQTRTVECDMAEPLAEGRADSIKLSVNVEYVVGNDDISDAMNSAISGLCFGKDYAGMDVNAAVGKWTAGCIDEYRKSNLDMLKSFAADDPDTPVDTSATDWLDKALSVKLYSLNWENHVSGSFSGRHGDVASYVASCYTYSGGAHGMSVENSVNLDVRTGKTVTEEDFFVPAYKDELASLLTSHLSDAMPDEESYDALFIKDIEPNDNFFVTEEALTYIYGQYEIGPYALGIIKVSIPWEELGDLVREHPGE